MTLQTILSLELGVETYNKCADVTKRYGLNDDAILTFIKHCRKIVTKNYFNHLCNCDLRRVEYGKFLAEMGIATGINAHLSSESPTVRKLLENFEKRTVKNEVLAFENVIVALNAKEVTSRDTTSVVSEVESDEQLKTVKTIATELYFMEKVQEAAPTVWYTPVLKDVQIEFPIFYPSYKEKKIETEVLVKVKAPKKYDSSYAWTMLFQPHGEEMGPCPKIIEPDKGVFYKKSLRESKVKEYVGLKQREWNRGDYDFLKSRVITGLRNNFVAATRMVEIKVENVYDVLYASIPTSGPDEFLEYHNKLYYNVKDKESIDNMKLNKVKSSKKKKTRKIKTENKKMSRRLDRSLVNSVQGNLKKIWYVGDEGQNKRMLTKYIKAPKDLSLIPKSDGTYVDIINLVSSCTDRSFFSTENFMHQLLGVYHDPDQVLKYRCGETAGYNLTEADFAVRRLHARAAIERCYKKINEPSISYNYAKNQIFRTYFMKRVYNFIHFSLKGHCNINQAISMRYVVKFNKYFKLKEEHGRMLKSMSELAVEGELGISFNKDFKYEIQRVISDGNYYKLETTDGVIIDLKLKN